MLSCFFIGSESCWASNPRPSCRGAIVRTTEDEVQRWPAQQDSCKEKTELEQKELGAPLPRLRTCWVPERVYVAKLEGKSPWRGLSSFLSIPLLGLKPNVFCAKLSCLSLCIIRRSLCVCWINKLTSSRCWRTTGSFCLPACPSQHL